MKMKLVEYLKEMYASRKIMLYCDIETFQFNEENGRKQPSEYKNMTFSVACSWNVDDIVYKQVFPNFKALFDVVIEVYQKERKKPKIVLNFHNGNKYDNHFLRKDLLYYYPHMSVENMFLMTATTDESNATALRLKDLKKEDKQGIILEKRIKSSINLELTFFLYGIQFETVDNWVKTNCSIATLGKKMKDIGVVDDSELKTDFDYLKYNIDEDMTDEKARAYALEIFNQLSADELKYIENDVILLCKSVYYYSRIFNGFDYSKRTFTSNILDSYNDNPLTSFQLLNRAGEKEDKVEVRYTDYHFSNINFYDYLKPFYRGGLNFYNQYHIGKIIEDGVFSMDINSSYPYAMHNFKIPTFLKSYEEHDTPQDIEIIYSDDEYSLYSMSKRDFDTLILDRIESVILRQMLVKYYFTNEFININSYTFRMIENITGIHFDSIRAYSRVTFSCQYFGSREQISEFYFTKTQGKYNKKLVYNSPYDMYLTDEDTESVFTPEEVANSKVNLNGLYGIPALRPYFNLFRKTDDGYINIINGHKNAERNIVFSIFVTSVSLWNLLDPLKYLTQEEIDENFIYCDTDSLYIKKCVQHKLPDELFHDFNLGKWTLEHENMTKFYVLNHKKYAYLDEKGEINVRSGGISHKSFNLDMDFEDFINTQFCDGAVVDTLKSIYTKYETIAIYPSKTKLEIGKGYRLRSEGKVFEDMKKKMFEDIRKEGDLMTSDVLYIESTLGTFSLADVYPFENEVKKKHPLVFLEMKQDLIRNLLSVDK